MHTPLDMMCSIGIICRNFIVVVLWVDSCPSWAIFWMELIFFCFFVLRVQIKVICDGTIINTLISSKLILLNIIMLLLLLLLLLVRDKGYILLLLTSIFWIVNHKHHTITTQKHLPHVALLDLFLLPRLAFEMRWDGIPQLLGVLKNHVEVLIKSFHAAINLFVVATGDENGFLFFHSIFE